MPVLFIGHGSPMNALADNDFTKTLNGLGKRIPTPKAIVCVSAHWMTEGTWVTHMKKPKTIHDFYGFPQKLFDVQYPAPGSPEVAESLSRMNKDIHLDDEMWGLDHGTWSVLKHMYPHADVPVLQLSLYMAKPASYHLKMGETLRSLREDGVLIVGSGNIVHNLRQIRWEDQAEPYDWAVEFDEWAKDKITKRDFESLTNLSSEAAKLSVPTMDHYYPLFYVLGASDKNDALTFEYEGLQNGSISMRTFTYG